jgi:outer membrane protein OmpA-like peptidoglycan-associated protein
MAQWPWSRPDQVTATCTVEPAQIEQGAPHRLRARIQATDTKKHSLAYVWAANGGQILGSGAEVQVDASGLNPGVYRVAGAAQDSYRNRATCTATFQVVAPTNPLSAECAADPAQVEVGEPARLRAVVSNGRGRSLRYSWFTNGGLVSPREAEATLETKDLKPGEYTVTSRVEDDLGNAGDCFVVVHVVLPPPPPTPAVPVALSQVVFNRNASALGPSERQQLGKVVERLRTETGGKVSLESYAAPDETRPQQLASARAEAVKRLLVENGIDSGRINVRVGLGGRLGGVRNRTLDVIWIPDGMEY